MTEQDIFEKMIDGDNIQIEKKNEDELWIYHKLWSEKEPIIKMNGCRDLPRNFIRRHIKDSLEFFWEDFEVVVTNARNVYEDMKR